MEEFPVKLGFACIDITELFINLPIMIFLKQNVELYLCINLYGAVFSTNWGSGSSGTGSSIENNPRQHLPINADIWTFQCIKPTFSALRLSRAKRQDEIIYFAAKTRAFIYFSITQA
jgi:hypothetical protein